MRGSGSAADNRGMTRPALHPGARSSTAAAVDGGQAMRRVRVARGGRRALLALLAPLVPIVPLVLAAWALPGARADDRRDHERARAAVQAGQVLPLPDLLQRLQRTHPGQVLELELEQDDGRWIYELKLLQDDGRLVELELDAASGQLLQSRRRRADPAAPAAPASRPSR